MKKISSSLKSYFWLVGILAILAASNVFLPQGQFLPAQDLPASKTVLALINLATVIIFYGGLGYVGFLLARKLDFADLWDERVSNYQRFVLPALLGAGIGVLFIIVDTLVSQFHSYGELPHPPFPTSLIASAVAGIGEELIFRLFFISFWVWLISSVILKGKGRETVFWVVALFSSIAFAASHLPALMILFDVKTIEAVPVLLLIEIFILNGVLSLLAAYYFRKFGFFAAVGIHFWADIIWHVIWGLF